jgi:hypothetical protein
MIGGHNVACTFSQVIDHLGAAKDIVGVFKQHPSLNPGHCHLRLYTQLEHVNHINHDMWTGDIVSGFYSD